MCHTTLNRKEGHFDLFVQIGGVTAASGEECRIALIDISERMRAEVEILSAREIAEALRLAHEVVSVR